MNPNDKQIQTTEEVSRKAEVSISEQLGLQKASLEKKHHADIEYYQSLVKSLKESRQASPDQTSQQPITTEFIESLMTSIKLERYQLLKSIAVYMSEWLDCVKDVLPKHMCTDLIEKCSIDTLDKVVPV